MSIPDSEPFIRVRDLRFRYAGATHDALSMPSFEVDRPGLVAITGPSGVGKSTLIELLAGTLNQRYSGSVQVLGAEWSELRGDRARQFHLRRIGLIPQDLGLLPNQTARQMLYQALIDAAVPKSECDDRIARALGRVELQPFADRRIAELSGGQRQRVAIARALVRNVELILADEPTANLHVELADETLTVLQRIATSIPVVMVTHDPRMAARCDRQVRVMPPSGAGPAATAIAAAAGFRAAAAVPAIVPAAGLASSPGSVPALIPIPPAASSAQAPGTPAFPPAPLKAAASPTAVTSRALRASADPAPRVGPAPAGVRPTTPGTPPLSSLRFAVSGAPVPSPAPMASALSRPAARQPAPGSSRVGPAPATARLGPAAPLAPTDDEAPARKPAVLLAAAAACGIAAVLGVLFAGPLASHPATSRQPAAAAVPPVTASLAPGTAAAPAIQAPATAAPPATTAASTTPAITTKPVTHTTTVSRPATTAPTAAPSTPAPAPSPSAQQEAIIATSTPNVPPSPAPSVTNPYQAWITFMQAFMGAGQSPPVRPTP